MQVIQASSPNYAKGRGGRKPIAIVDHITAGLMPGCLSWLRNPDSKASAHYLVTKKGEIYQLVADGDTAYANGNIRKPNWSLCDGTNPNRYTLSIEHEGLAGQSLTEEQYQGTLWLHRQLIERHKIPVDDQHIIGHYRIDSVVKANCPGPGFPWARLFTDLWQPPAQPVKIRMVSRVIDGLLINDTSYGPVRALAEAWGYRVEWDGIKNTVIIPPVNVVVPSGAPGTVQVVTGGCVIPGILHEDRAYAPVRALAQALGKTVEWDGQNNTVTVSEEG